MWICIMNDIVHTTCAFFVHTYIVFLYSAHALGWNFRLYNNIVYVVDHYCQLTMLRALICVSSESSEQVMLTSAMSCTCVHTRICSLNVGTHSRILDVCGHRETYFLTNIQPHHHNHWLPGSQSLPGPLSLQLAPQCGAVSLSMQL